MEYKGFGVGCMGMTAANAKESIEVIHAAVDAGVTFLDTADFYRSGESEMVIGQAIKSIPRDKVYLSVKFGALNEPGGMMYGLDVQPFHIKNYLTHSLRRLGVDYIDLYQPGRIDLDIPVEEVVGELSELVKAGYIRHIGLSHVDAQTLIRAEKVHKIEAVEMEYSLFNRSMETELLPEARRLGTGVVAFGVIAHGLLSGAWTKERLRRGPVQPVITNTLFNPENIEKNVDLAERLQRIAEKKHITLSQLAHAWVRAKGEDVIPLIGASKLAHFQEAWKAAQITLSEEEIKEIEAAVPEKEIAGESFRDMKFKSGRVAGIWKKK